VGSHRGVPHFVTKSSPSGVTMGTFQCSEVGLWLSSLSLWCRGTRPAPNPAAESTRPRKTRAAVTLPLKTESIAEHDPTLLVAALEDIESKRLAIDWLLDAGLLGQFLV
jgi:hypothetical protein